jgi:uncharacterized protein
MGNAMLLVTFETQVAYGFLTLALASLWMPRITRFSNSAIPVWLIFLASAISSGLFFGFLQPLALLWAALFGSSAWALTQSNLGLAAKSTLFLVVFGLSAGLMTHQLPGFDNPKMIAELRLSEDALPYNKHLNFDSALVGLCLLGFFHHRLGNASGWLVMLKKMTPISLKTLATVMALSLALGYVHWQPKWTPVFFVWAWGNLFFTCIAEEAFFRGFIQEHLSQGLSKMRCGQTLAILLAACIFGLAHHAGGIKYTLLATVAGIGYGLAYHRAQRIEAAILTHFTLNALHFLLFTYPVLAASV